jgi:uncharacterized protein with PIN domain
MDETPRFAADRMLARLARWLRILGADVKYDSQLGGHACLRAARSEGRILLTRDKRLRSAPEVLFIDSNAFRDQLRQVLAAFPFDPRAHAFSRCSHCNRLVREIGPGLAARFVPPYVFASQKRFALCDGCGRVYWGGTHPQRVMRELESLGL